MCVIIVFPLLLPVVALGKVRQHLLHESEKRRGQLLGNISVLFNQLGGKWWIFFFDQA
jgi:hypothetical protein